MDNWKLTSIANEAPTLKDLQSLSVQKQSMLLLRRLATQFVNPNNSFGKMNFGISAYASFLVQGYPGNEATQVKNLLLGAPWKRLETDGFIRDNGQGFFVVTEEGFAAAVHCEVVVLDQAVLSALDLLHPDFRNYGHYFRENKLKEAVATAFERYENRLNEIRDKSRKTAVKSSSGHDLVYKLFDERVLKRPYPKLGGTPAKREAFKKGLCGILSGGVSWIRNAYTHEKHRLPELDTQQALELLFVASYMMRMLDQSLASR